MKLTKQMKLHGALLQEFGRFLDEGNPEHYDELLHVLKAANDDFSMGIVGSTVLVYKERLRELMPPRRHRLAPCRTVHHKSRLT